PLVDGRHPPTVASRGPEFEGAGPSAAEEPGGGGGRHVAGHPGEARMAQRDADDDGAQRAMEDLAQGRRLDLGKRAVGDRVQGLDLLRGLTGERGVDELSEAAELLERRVELRLAHAGGDPRDLERV